ncbi:hypothetical protein GETHPA_01870 [Geothrix rubra]|uniref:Uncharacterized protein n=1 Tax=Geothrix rubra TaxID=2927977 RepID=A0ABQ5Q2Q2_9BACT|nr:hypothetical protein [Geothrix rubra]GLH68654.1 hypothetical protein GETHPA_01870 [Geothrix rubra]
MRTRLALITLLSAVLGVGGWFAYQNGLVPVPLVPDAPLYAPASPDFGEDQAVLEALVPAGPGLDAFLANQSDLALLTRTPDGAWAGQLVDGLQRSRNGRRWRLTFKAGLRLQDGSELGADRADAVLAPAFRGAGARDRVLDGRTLELRFATRTEDVPERLATWRVPGSGPFVRKGTVLARFDGFVQGRAGLARLRVETDPALMASAAWAQGLASGRWAWAAYPGRIDPEDMARVRLAPYDEVRLTDGSVWFISQKLRRFQPDKGPWPETRLFGVWRGSMDLPRAGALP